MAGCVKLSVEQWIEIRRQIKKEYGCKTSLLTSVMLKELGFTVRYQEWVYLDFYTDAAETFFCLKYLAINSK